jgi:hypothetical protein
MTPVDGVKAGTMLVRSNSGRPNLPVLEAGNASEPSGNDLGQSCRVVPGPRPKTEPSQMPLQLRRGEDSEQASYEILSPMGSPGLASNADSDASAFSGNGVSAFISISEARSLPA